MVFWSHHVPQGIIKLKKKEFEDLKQGSMTVSEYVTHFTQLSMLKTMWTPMKRSRIVFSMVWMTILLTLQRRVTSRISRWWWTKLLCYRIGEEFWNASTNRSARVNTVATPGPVFVLHLLDPFLAPMQQNVQPMPQLIGQGFATPQRQMISCPNGYQTPNTGTPTTQDTTPMKADKTCSNCGRKGHFALQCPNRHQQSTPTLRTPPPNCIGNSTLIQAMQNYVRGRINQMAIEEAQNAPINGTFLINSNSVLNHSLTSFLFCYENLGVRFLLRG
jgi:hypothetical protein